jgi:hypothetical protein
MTGEMRQEIILQGAWLGQYLFYTVFRSVGAWGIIIMKALVLCACLLVAYRRSRSAGAGSIPALLIMALSGLTLTYFTGERPQLLSFLIASVVVWLLDIHERSGKNWPLYLVPLLMLVWANCHGSAPLGAVLLCLYGAGHIAETTGSRSRGALSPRLLIVLGIAAACTLVTPNGVKSYLYLLQLEGSVLQSRTSEYRTPIQVALLLGRFAPSYWILALLAACSAGLFLRDRQIKVAVTVAFLAGISFMGWRYIPFFVLLAAPAMAMTVQRLAARMPESGRMVYGTVILACCGVLLFGIARGMAFSRSVEAGRFPERLVDVASAHNLSGRAFNSVDWGGYILWRLYPTVRPYIDGRVIDVNVLVRYTHMLWATEQGLRFFEEEHFDLVMLPRANALTGEVYPLPRHLLGDKGWSLVFEDAHGFLFKKSRTDSLHSMQGEQRPA